MAQAIYLAVKETQEIIPLIWNLENRTPVSATVTVTTELGIDPSPSNILGIGPIISGSECIQYIEGGIRGVTYRIELVANLSDSTVYVGIAYLPVQDLV